MTVTVPETVAPPAGAVIEHGRRRRVGGRGGGRLVPGGADVAGGVLGGDLVVVGAGGEPGVGVARPGRLRDPVRRRRREARGRRAVDVVAGDPALSVAAPQLSAICPRPPVAVSVPGALGGSASGEVTEVFMSAWISVADSARL